MPSTTAFLSLDLQRGIFGYAPGSEVVIGPAKRILDHARRERCLVIHVGLGFRPGHPELSDREGPFKRVKENGLFVKGSESAEFAKGIVQPGDLVIYKQRVGAFSENELHLILRAQGIERLVFFGIATSGIVLSTLRRAFDLDYESVVIEDACYDRDEEVHRVLTQKIFPGQAKVMTADAFLSERP